MTTPVWVLLLFAGWTILTLLGTVGAYRWSRILRGRAGLTEFPADVPHGAEWYRRAIRAHANCLENLPVYGAIVVAIVATGARSGLLDGLAVTLLAARVLQTLTHVAFTPTERIVAIRFAFFATQLACMIWMGAVVAAGAGGETRDDVHGIGKGPRTPTSCAPTIRSTRVPSGR